MSIQSKLKTGLRTIPLVSGEIQRNMRGQGGYGPNLKTGQPWRAPSGHEAVRDKHGNIVGTQKKETEEEKKRKAAEAAMRKRLAQY